MTGRLLRLFALIILFWMMFIEATWLLAIIYMPWMKTVTSGLEGSLSADIPVWLSVLAVMAGMLLFFREFFYSLFWYEASKHKAKGRVKQRSSE